MPAPRRRASFRRCGLIGVLAVAAAFSGWLTVSPAAAHTLTTRQEAESMSNPPSCWSVATNQGGYSGTGARSCGSFAAPLTFSVVVGGSHTGSAVIVGHVAGDSAGRYSVNSGSWVPFSLSQNGCTPGSTCWKPYVTISDLAAPVGESATFVIAVELVSGFHLRIDYVDLTISDTVTTTSSTTTTSTTVATTSTSTSSVPTSTSTTTPAGGVQEMRLAGFEDEALPMILALVALSLGIVTGSALLRRSR